MVLTATSICRYQQSDTAMHLIWDSGQWQFLDRQTIFVEMIRLFTSQVTMFSRQLLVCWTIVLYACSKFIIPKMNTLNSDLIMFFGPLRYFFKYYIFLYLLWRYDLLYSCSYPPADLTRENLNFNEKTYSSYDKRIRKQHKHKLRNLENIKRFALGIYIWKALSVILLKIQKEETITNMW